MTFCVWVLFLMCSIIDSPESLDFSPVNGWGAAFGLFLLIDFYAGVAAFSKNKK